ncbi:MAG: hypothetical protein ILN61_02215 [Lachnospiraceae bacterium]|nr:hypothetical protein [Lachnospiraceae bacterium]MBP5414044.1 hypothetical protein [Lachnospiraceae bacterium]
MKYPFFASFLVLCAIFYHNRKKADRSHAKIMQDYFKRENEANNTRKQPLDDLEYIKIDLSKLPTQAYDDDDLIKECIKDITRLCEESIVNFTGLTNTDLKLKYGPANLPFLQQCDLNYTQLVRILNTWANRLFELNDHDSALIVSEYAISLKADISNIYYMASDIYIEKGTPEKILSLIEIAEELNSVMKDHIVENLRSKL